MSTRELQPSREVPQSRDRGVRIHVSSRNPGGPYGFEGPGVGFNVPRGTAMLVDAHIGKDPTPTLLAMQALIGLYRTDSTNPHEVSLRMSDTFDKAQALVRAEAPNHDVSATAVTVVDSVDGRVAVIGSTGRSHAFLLHNGSLTQLTDESSKPLGDEAHTGSTQMLQPVEAGDRILLIDKGAQFLSKLDIRRALQFQSDNPADEVVQRAKFRMDNDLTVTSGGGEINAVFMDIVPRVIETDIQGGKELVVPYEDAPVTVAFEDGPEFEVGLCHDLGIPCRPEDRNTMLVVHRRAFLDAQGRGGYQWLTNAVFIGRVGDTDQWMLHSGGNVSNVRIAREESEGGTSLRISDLHSRVKPTVKYTSLK